MSLRITKARRVFRRIPKAWLHEMIETFLNRGQLLALLASIIGLWLLLQTATLEQRDMLALDWAVGIQAFALAMVGWAVISLIRAPIIVIRKDREKGAWRGRKFIYFAPELIGVGYWTDDDHDKRAVVVFEDAEPDSFVQYSIEIYPPVEKRASFFIEQIPGQMLQLFANINPADPQPGEEHKAAIKSLLGGARAGGRGGVQLIGNTAHLAVVLEDGTVPVMSRVYMHSFEVRESKMSMPQRFDKLLRAMLKGESPKSRKDSSQSHADSERREPETPARTQPEGGAA